MPTVLVVSQDADLRAVVSRVLTNAGCQVRSAAHAGHALLACMDGEAFDVLIVDEQSAGGPGAAVVDRLGRYGDGVPVVRLCDPGAATASDRLDLVRPFSAYDLIGAVSDATHYARRGAMTL